MLRKWILVLVIVAMLVSFSFVGCSTTTETTAAETTAAETTAAETTAAETTAAETTEAKETKLFSLADVPEIENKEPLNLVLETGSLRDAVVTEIEKFSAKTGIEISVERVSTSMVYTKQNLELASGTGTYDMIYTATGWIDDWAPYLLDIEELANQYDTLEALKEDLANHGGIFVAASHASDGRLMGIPSMTYHVGMFIRQDVFDNATEQANFKAKYSYDLKPATSFKELYDQAEFFTRKKGDLLKDKPLDHDLYGVALQAGAYQNNDELATYLWGKGIDWVTVVKNDDGTKKEYVITKKDQQGQIETLKEYISLLQFASPGCLTANYDFVITEQGEGRAIIQPTMYSNGFVWTTSLVKDPEAKIGIYPTLGKRPFTGTFAMGVSKDSKNPEAAYWLIRYLSSFESQKQIMITGGELSTRIDVTSDPVWKTDENIYPFGPLVDYLASSYKEPGYAEFLSNIFYFNSPAGGKVYDMQINILSRAISGEVSVEDGLKELWDQTVELTQKNDKIPIRIEE